MTPRKLRLWLAASCCASLAACAGGAHRVQRPLSDFQQALARERAGSEAPGQQAAQTQPREVQPARVTRDPRPNFILPAVEIVAMDALINAAGRRGPEADAYKVDAASIQSNIQGKWIVDNDPFAVNQMMHPYQGAMYHNIARSSGLTFWPSLAYTFAGSVMWEIAGETTTPAWNDQLASGIAGTFLGEALFRMANLLVDRSHEHVGFGRGLLVFLASPPTAINRLTFGTRFDGVMPTHDPAYDLRVQFGARGTSENTPGPSLNLGQREAIADILVEYGLPGRAGYSFTRPFDYFRLDATASSVNIVEKVTSHGVLAGRRYETGPDGGGVWGLYGIYDYLSPQFFRVSTTAVSGGTSFERWLLPGLLMQVTALGGVGYAAVQTINGTNDRDYHYGVTPQAVETLRLVIGNRLSIDTSARQYFVSGVAGFDTPGTDTILRAEISGAVRIYGRNAVTVRYQTTRRTATFPGFGTQKQSIGTISVAYTVLGPQRLGATKHR
ncbi:MAG TPA: DUF3943 domain-containing protein [Vicinamibacterales bacterium]|nr:DUF3943 domain-containing protein [Vicinamibacterales bacterium]